MTDDYLLDPDSQYMNENSFHLPLNHNCRIEFKMNIRNIVLILKCKNI